MPRSQAVLHFDVFEGLGGCTDDEMLLYFAILTEPTVNQAGVGALRLSLWTRRRRKPISEIETALRGLDGKRYVFYDDRTEEILVRSLIRRDGVADQPNLLWAACRAAPLLKSPRLRRELAAELRKLPPKRPDTITKTGRVFVHADPHAVADTLDPPPEPVDNPVDNSPREGFEKGSRTHREGSPREGFEKGSRRLGGGGGGGGGGSCPVGGLVGGPRASHTPAADHPHDSTAEQPQLGLLGAVPPLLDRAPRCRKHRRLPADVDPGPCPGCAGERHRWERRRDQQRADDAAARQAAADGCGTCHGTSWRELPPLTPTSQARAVRCDHRPVQAVPATTDARGHPA